MTDFLPFTQNEYFLVFGFIVALVFVVRFVNRVRKSPDHDRRPLKTTYVGMEEMKRLSSE